MKKAVTTGERRKITITEAPVPKAGAGMLLLKIRYCGICGSDLEYLDGSYEFGNWGKLRAGDTLGHEFIAEIAEMGEGVKGWSVGDRVTVGGSRRTTCGQCYFCRRGYHQLCVGGDSRALSYDLMGGYGKLIGAMAEYIVLPATSVQRVPDSVSDEEAALVEPFATGVASVVAAGLKAADSAVIIGAGRIGLGALQCAKASGVSPIIMIDLVKSRLDKAREMGADAVINPGETDVIAEVVRLTEAGPDAVLVCVRDGKVLEQSIDMVRRGGIIVLAGFIPPVTVNPGVIVVKALRLVGLQGVPGCVDTSMHLIKTKQVNLKPIITEKIPLAEVQRAFDSMWSGKNIGVLLKP